ncbi:hypothetical protein H1V43_04035 [Streptomyces sp. PSKA54]|uniref:Uncharacterized protein n=1 Tax=Streptomyces himalayensis subsp. aureolus TaxID=2758039 RepID=A0A7W2CX83_9ACTN|nr:hypothetical protein [Streptomyces himalayensis]MBA4860560.1 hypothetical protein [Streptomyces himalayensis subsp. aureolus]
MVSSPHEAMHRVFQQDPGVFARAVRALGIPFDDPVSATPLPTDLTENRPLERRVDTLLRMDAADGTSFVLAVEAQGKKDPDKPASWSYYLAHLYAKYRLPPLLVVVCRDRTTASWATRHVHIGPPQWPSLTLRPLVLGPENVPVIDTPDAAARDIPLAVLSAILHGRDRNSDAILNALAAALGGLQVRDQDTANTFIELIAQGLGTGSAADFWRILVTVDTSFFQSPLAQGLRAEGEANALLRFLDRRGIAISDSDREHILSCSDLDTLNQWIDRAATASSIEEVFTGE